MCPNERNKTAKILKYFEFILGNKLENHALNTHAELCLHAVKVNEKDTKIKQLWRWTIRRH